MAFINVVNVLLKTIEKAKAQRDEYNNLRYSEMLKRVQHGHRLTEAEKMDINAYLNTVTIGE